MNDFDALPEMKDSDRDLVLVMLWTNAIFYDHPVNDIFFSAHVPDTIATVAGRNASSYMSDYPASAMACTQQVIGMKFTKN
jgi:hypothetical protein